jgi:hypothetical protein
MPATPHAATILRSRLRPFVAQDLLPMQGLALLKGTVVVAGACCSIGSMGATLSVEKDWTKTMTAGDPAALSKLNAGKWRAKGGWGGLGSEYPAVSKHASTATRMHEGRACDAAVYGKHGTWGKLQVHGSTDAC